MSDETIISHTYQKSKRAFKSCLFILSAPSGAGKTTLCDAIRDLFPDIVYSISTITRQPRKGEKHAVDYYFIDKRKFEKKIKDNQWAEWAEVYGNYYGTSAEYIDRQLSKGRSILLDIDIEGTKKILNRYPDSITIFIMPPSLEVLKERLDKRGTDSEQVINKRIKNAAAEISQRTLYQHIVINDNLTDTIEQLTAIINKYMA